jgi:hypothetical protein
MQFGRYLRCREVGGWRHTNYKLNPDYINDTAIGLSITIIEKDSITGWEDIRRGILESFDEVGFKIKPSEGKKKTLEAQWGTPGFIFSYIDADNRVVNDLEEMEHQEEIKKRRAELDKIELSPDPIKPDVDTKKPDHVESEPPKKKRKPRSDKGKKRGPRKSK